MNLKETLYKDILPRVEKPSRYLGTELNSVHKDPKSVEMRVCFFFPDLYELGLGNLGLHILYAILNERDWIWAERGYSPALDMEAMLRDRELPLFMYESKDPLTAADLVGFTMQSELTYTNLLNAIDLAGMEVRSENRREEDPLLFAGGPTSFNPEPMAPFLDFFLMGEGEDAIVELVETLRPLKNASKREKLEAISKLEGFYVPSLYPMETLPDGQILPPVDGPVIRKRLVQSLDGSTFPTKYIVPFTQLVHDGIGLEVLRGCTQGCRFCQAGMVTRPVRERTLEKVDELMEQSLANTGYEHVTLVSLSTCDFSRPRTLVKNAVNRAHKENVSISLPSLRLDSFAVEMSDMVAGVRRSGLTFAPEAATPRLRAVINKFIPDEELLTMSAEAYRRGWGHVKTYFMIGLPTERDEDVIAIADLCIRTLQMGREITGRAGVRTGVSTFVPKPFTPFQWAPQIDIEETERKQALLRDKFRRHSGIKFGRHAPESSFIEGLITRADRRAADLIEAAWRRGAKLETWDEHVNIDHWWQAIEETGYDWRFQLRERDPEERLPWDHIDVLIDKKWFQQDWKKAQELKYAQDCRAGKCHLCGVIYRERELCKTMLKNQKAGLKEEAETWEGVPEKSLEQPDPVQRIRFRIGRLGEARFLSHLELKDAWIRALRRARAPLAYTHGFNAQPRINFATASPVGEESIGDYMDVLLQDHADAQDLFARLSAVLPPGFRLFAAQEMPLRGDSLMSSVEGFSYMLYTTEDGAAIKQKIQEIMLADEVIIDRKVKGKRKGKGSRGRDKAPKQMAQLNVRPMLAVLRIAESNGEQVTIEFTTRAVNGKLAKAKDVMRLLGLEELETRVLKLNTHLVEEPEVALT
jgi:radical SAM family uncharacterized protein/radical SAM-linked protein